MYYQFCNEVLDIFYPQYLEELTRGVLKHLDGLRAHRELLDLVGVREVHPCPSRKLKINRPLRKRREIIV